MTQPNLKKETLNCLKEMRDACAACFRVLSRRMLWDEADHELFEAGVKKGFRARCDKLIAKIEKEKP